MTGPASTQLVELQTLPSTHEHVPDVLLKLAPSQYQVPLLSSACSSVSSAAACSVLTKARSRPRAMQASRDSCHVEAVGLTV